MVEGLSPPRRAQAGRGARNLTYMSIQAEMRDRLRRGMLYRLRPGTPYSPVRRTMLVDEVLWRELTSPEGDEEWETRIGELRADLEDFCVNPTIHPRFLFLLHPARDAVWEIRSIQRPSIRVLGLFALTDVFVATKAVLRRDLGSWRSPAWKVVKRAARASWRRLFPTYDAVVTTDVRDVVTGAIDGKAYLRRQDPAS